MQKEEKQLSLVSPTTNQTSKTLHSISRVRTYNELKDDPHSPMQKEEKQLPLASPTANQTSKTLHSISRVRTYNELKDDPLFLHLYGTSNTN